MKEYSVVGKPLTRVDGRVKVTGLAQYASDITLPNMLHGKILRSPHPHAKIVNIDTSQAEALPGVKAVVTGKDTGGIRFGFVDTPRYPADEYPLAIDKVRYIGEEVAAVAAIDEITAAEALSLIEVDYEPMPAIFDPEEALKDGAPKVHEEILTDGGRIINPSFADYKIPGVCDIAEFRHIPVESIEPKGPFGGKEVGECSRAAVIAAIANAICDAIGVRIYSLPITPEKILEALKNKGK